MKSRNNSEKSEFTLLNSFVNLTIMEKTEVRPGQFIKDFLMIYGVRTGTIAGAGGGQGGFRV